MTGSRPAAADASEDELIARAAQGDLSAFARIVRVHHADMTRIAYLVTGDLDTAAMATHAAWPAAWNGLRRTRVPEELGPWLCSLAATGAVDVLSKANATGDDPVPAEIGPIVSRTVAAGDPTADDLLRALARLDPRDRALLALRHVAGISPDDLARMHRRSRPPVAVRLDRLASDLGGSPPGPASRALELTLGQRLTALARVPIDPVSSDSAARWTRAEVADERTRRISIAVSAVAGALVAGFPYLARLLHGH